MSTMSLTVVKPVPDIDATLEPQLATAPPFNRRAMVECLKHGGHATRKSFYKGTARFGEEWLVCNSCGHRRKHGDVRPERPL